MCEDQDSWTVKELLCLSDMLPEELRKENEAATLVIRNGASVIRSEELNLSRSDFKPKPKFTFEPASSSTLIFAVAILCLFICHLSLLHLRQII